MNKTLLILAVMLTLSACDKKDKGSLAHGWDGPNMNAGCSYAPQIHQGALQNIQRETIAINADPIGSPLDKVQVLMCYDAACTNPYKSSSCAPLGSGETCQTSIPSPHIVLASQRVDFVNAYGAGFRGYFISEAACQ